MIQVANLTKRFGSFTAIDDLNFEVAEGEIVGFLGPNGAGKSTTMKILASYLPPSSGQVTVGGFDVFRHSVEVRSQLGYLPENTPLYTDMRVGEYLRYRARLKGVVGGKVRQAVGDVLALCALLDVERKLIGALSKGYRQRVGLADALVHDPKLLILDEPTIGLDPNQIRDVRELIRNLSGRRTVLISTHILPEVEIMCSRVIVIHRGKIRAADTADNLIKNTRASSLIQFEAEVGGDDAITALSALAGVKEVIDQNPMIENTFLLRLEANADPTDGMLRMALSRDWKVRGMTRRRPTLEDVFVELTQSDN